jgi:signal transduction histidine kinase
MISIKRVERIIFPLAAGILVCGLIAAILGIGYRELTNRRLYLELETYRTLTALTDLVRAGGLSAGDINRVNAFGVYALDGQAIFRYGPAPNTVETQLASGVPSIMQIGDKSIVMYRLLGNDIPNRRPGGMPLMGRMRRETQTMVEAIPAMAYIDYAIGDYSARRFWLVLMLVGIAIVLAALYGVSLYLYRRYLGYADRESRNRELVELGQAARTIVHEIKNPLGVIQIQCGLIRRDSAALGSTAVMIIEDEVARLANMADRIRAYLNPIAEEVVEINVRSWFDAFSDRYAGTLTVSMTALNGQEVIRMVPDRLADSLDNLISNALEATPASAQQPDLAITVAQRRLCISIGDHGPGVSEDDRKRLFEPFFTTKARGTGLGLALARKYMESYGGTISYTNRSAGGSLFTISLPLYRMDQART